MTNANAEAQRRWRQRQKEKRKEGLKHGAGVATVFKAPFFEFVGDLSSSSDFADAFDLAGIAVPEFVDDRGPEAFSLDGGAEGAGVFENAKGSLGRAEVMVGCLITAALDLARLVNQYKRQEIKARLAEIEAADLSAPEVKRAALQEAARLNKMLDQLDKQVRWTFPQWKVTG